MCYEFLGLPRISMPKSPKGKNTKNTTGIPIEIHFDYREIRSDLKKYPRLPAISKNYQRLQLNATKY